MSVRSFAVGLLAVLFVAAALARADAGGLTRSQLALDLLAGADTKTVPPNLEPPLAAAA